MAPSICNTPAPKTPMPSLHPSTDPDVQPLNMNVPAQLNPRLASSIPTASRPKRPVHSPILVAPRLHKSSRIDSSVVDYNPFSRTYNTPFDAGWRRSNPTASQTQSSAVLPMSSVRNEDGFRSAPADHAINISDGGRVAAPSVVERSSTNDDDIEAFGRSPDLPPRCPRPSRLSRFSAEISRVGSGLDYQSTCWVIVSLMHLTWFTTTFVIIGLPEAWFPGGDDQDSQCSLKVLLIGFVMNCFLVGTFAECMIVVAYEAGKRYSSGRKHILRPWLATLVVAVSVFNSMIFFVRSGCLV